MQFGGYFLNITLFDWPDRDQMVQLRAGLPYLFDQCEPENVFWSLYLFFYLINDLF